MRCSVVFGVTLRLLVINISSSSPAISTAAYYQQSVSQLVVRRRRIDNTWPVAALTSRNEARLVQNHYFCLPHLHSTLPLEKLEWLGYPMVKKIWRYVYSFWQNVRSWQTHRWTDRWTDTTWRLRPRLHSIAHRQKLIKVNCRAIFRCPGPGRAG